MSPSRPGKTLTCVVKSSSMVAGCHLDVDVCRQVVLAVTFVVRRLLPVALVASQADTCVVSCCRSKAGQSRSQAELSTQAGGMEPKKGL